MVFSFSVKILYTYFVGNSQANSLRIRRLTNRSLRGFLVGYSFELDVVQLKFFRKLLAFYIHVRFVSFIVS